MQNLKKFAAAKYIITSILNYITNFYFIAIEVC